MCVSREHGYKLELFLISTFPPSALAKVCTPWVLSVLLSVRLVLSLLPLVIIFITFSRRTSTRSSPDVVRLINVLTYLLTFSSRATEIVDRRTVSGSPISKSPDPAWHPAAVSCDGASSVYREAGHFRSGHVTRAAVKLGARYSRETTGARTEGHDIRSPARR